MPPLLDTIVLASFVNLVGPDLIVIALILLILSAFHLPFAIVMGFIAQRKGQSVPLFCILGLIPIVNVVSAVWLASLLDTTVEKRLAKLESKSAQQT
jgi:hypothetical protein